MIREPARAKINLALHVTGRRDDGYHLIDTLVVFADLGDVVTAETARSIGLSVDGPFAGQLSADEDNLVLRAARALQDRRRFGEHPIGARLTLTKTLPVASGIGGGSADAAATLRALNRLWDLDIPTSRLRDIGEPLGADIPLCVAGVPARATGIGTRLQLLPELAGLHAVLVNPRLAVSTPSVFAALEERHNPPLPEPRSVATRDDLIGYLGATRNDLETPATALVPEITAVLNALAAIDGCRLSRMSGSGATCFGVFDDRTAANSAAAAIAAAYPHWWVAATDLQGSV